MHRSVLDKANTCVRFTTQNHAKFGWRDGLSIEPNHESPECEACPQCEQFYQVPAGGSSLAGGSLLEGGTSDDVSVEAGTAASPCARLSSMSRVFSRRIT